MSGINIGIIIAGNVKNDDANIIGITPAITSFKGICVFCAPTIFLPTTLFEYCTGTLLSACCTNTTAVTNIKAPIIIPNDIKSPVVLNTPEPIIKFQIVVIAPGNPDIIPTNIIIDIPFPIPLFVISSPSHINKAVPAIKEITTVNPVINPVFMNIPVEPYDKYNPTPSIKARNTVRILVYLLIFFDFLQSHASYGNSNGHDGRNSTYGVLVGKEGNCVGFAGAYKLLANAVGLRCGFRHGAGHQWNAVYVNGEWKDIDASSFGSYASSYLDLTKIPCPYCGCENIFPVREEEHPCPNCRVQLKNPNFRLYN